MGFRSHSSTSYGPYFSGLQLCGFRSGSFHWGGHYGWLYCLLVRLLRARYPKCCERIDPVPGMSEEKMRDITTTGGSLLLLCRFSFSYLTSSKNLSSSRAGNCESLEKAKESRSMAEQYGAIPAMQVRSGTAQCSWHKYKWPKNLLTSFALHFWPQQSPN